MPPEKKYAVYGKVVGTKYLGEVMACSESEAVEKAESLGSNFVSVCHQCSKQISDPEIVEITAEEA